MLKTCEMCSNDFITEADPYVVIPRPSGVKYYCSCMIVQGNEQSTIDRLKAEINKLLAEIEWLRLLEKH
jgi:hypothetical protein